jgi:uroporphyrinogen-III decarboxylase
MNVKVEKILEEKPYRAVLVNVEEKETTHGRRLMWTFRIVDENVEVVGFTSMSPSSRAKAYQWARALMGEIDPRVGWGPEDVVDRECVVVLKVGEDAQGFQKNKVVDVRPLGQEGHKTDGPSFDGIPF